MRTYFRMETNGEPRKIQISSTTKTLLDLTEAGTFVTKARGPIHIKGKGFIETFWLLGRRFNRQKTLKKNSMEESQPNDENEVEESMEGSLDVMDAMLDKNQVHPLSKLNCRSMEMQKLKLEK